MIFNYNYMQSKILLVEGICGVGKSTLINNLIKHNTEFAKEKDRTFLHLTQIHTYGPLAPDEDSLSLTKEKNIKHLEEIYNILKWHVNSIGSRENIKFLCLIDTLHITHCVRPGIVDWEDVKEYDNKLKELGCKSIFLKANDENIRKRTIDSRKENKSLMNYYKKFGNTSEEIHNYFINEQKELNSMFDKSKLHKKLLDVNCSEKNYVETVYNFWLE